jgi:glutamyl-tRNA reductase
MRLFAVGISHRTAPVELRECLDFSRRGLDAALEALGARNLAREAVVLSTCNRAEIYATAGSEGAAESCSRFIADYHGVPWDTVAPHVVMYRGSQAADHLFRVAAGLDSLVVRSPTACSPPRSPSASACARRRGSAKGRSRSATPRLRWRRRFSAS